MVVSRGEREQIWLVKMNRWDKRAGVGKIKMNLSFKTE